MHFRIKRIKLLNALAKATRAVSVRSPLPVLTGIKFDLQAHQLILTGSDSDITIQTIIDEDDDLVILKEGAVVLNSRYIFDIVRKINSDDIEIEIIDGLLTRIKGSQIEYSLKTGNRTTVFSNTPAHYHHVLQTVVDEYLKDGGSNNSRSQASLSAGSATWTANSFMP